MASIIRSAIKVTGKTSSLNSVSFLGQQRSIFSSLRPSIPYVAKQETIDKVSEVVGRLQGVNKTTITGDTRFKEDLRYDSLDLAEILMALEQSFGIAIGEERTKGVATVKDAADMIEKVIY